MINEIIKHNIAFITFFALSIGSSIVVLRVLDKANFKEENFQKDRIITSSGVLFLFFLLFYALYLFFFENNLVLKGWPYSLLIVSFGVGLLGFYDDLFGDSEEGGFAGHFGALAKGKVTTGVIKAVFGFALALYAAYLASSGIEIIINALIIALSVNFFNLLDLRPGRSLKTFIAAFALIFIFSNLKTLLIVSIPILAPVIVLLYLDLKLKAMLGDTGSNILGGLIGIYVVYSFTLKVNLGILLVLIIVHLYSEKRSISSFVSKNSVLRWLDGLGLKKSS
ncbi:MAG: hypothetical protein E3J54_02200 [Actinobacteria bacterium]|nr:MAG: hypothetical protein E3J54_02200 [Actinomycetota bacterium]